MCAAVTSIGPVRALLAALAVVLSCAGAPVAAQTSPATAPQVNPTASAVQERQLLEALQGSGPRELQGRVSIPDPKAATLIRPAGREWREFHQGTMHLIGGGAILGMIALLAVFYLARGRIRIDAGPSSERLLRFNALERFTHWMTAVCFIVLAISGLNITFGKSVLLPLLGPSGFTAFSQLGKYAHNYLAFPFMFGVLLMFVVWFRENIPGKVDLAWFRAGGGIIGKGHPPAKKFNGGQKLVFWSVIGGGAILSLSGWHLLFPFDAGGVLQLQFWNVVHGVVSVLLIAVMLAHAYIGSIGMEGAFDAMGSGEVDLNWAKEHHSLWVAEEIANGSVQVPRGLQPAE